MDPQIDDLRGRSVFASGRWMDQALDAAADAWRSCRFIVRRLVLGSALTALGGLAACSRGDKSSMAGVLEGNPKRGVVAMQHYSCASCHRIPGVVGAKSWVGPPLAGMAKRKYIAGFLPNTPDNMIKWLQDPQELAPASAMPDVGVTDGDARDIAAYLYRLE